MLVISINVCKDPNFLSKQLQNIAKYVKIPYTVILSCNDFMYEELKELSFEHVILNPSVINKKRFHGSLAHGIYSNMKFCVDNNIGFSKFLILSARTFFFYEVNKSTIFPENTFNPNHLCSAITNKAEINYKKWYWPKIIRTSLFKFFFDNKHYQKISRSRHEGLVLGYHVCKNIIHFFENHTIIKDELFGFDTCVEEFALQTISVNYCGDNNNTGFGSLLVTNKTISETVANRLLLKRRPDDFSYVYRSWYEYELVSRNMSIKSRGVSRRRHKH